MTEELNPYAVPKARLDAAADERDATDIRSPQAIAAAREALDRHLAAPENVAADRRLEDWFMPRWTAIALVLPLIASMAAVIWGQLDNIYSIVAGFGYLFGAILFKSIFSLF